MSRGPPEEPAERGREVVTIVRDFDFARESVFRMLTDPKEAVKVWGPEGSVKHLFELEPRPGGALTIHDGDAEGVIARTSGTFLEFVAPERFVFRSETTPREGGAPWEALQKVTLEELSPSRTRVTVRVRVLAAGSFPGGLGPLERGYLGGWGETLDMLQRALP
jgi:uncharacterized protein YndB with AHSA1/START domain